MGPEGVLGSCSGSGGGRGKRVDKKATDTALLLLIKDGVA